MRTAKRARTWSLSLALVATITMAWAGTARAADLIESFDGAVLNSDGSASSQAGAHPDVASTAIKISDDGGGFFAIPLEDSKNIVVDLPPGFIGNPQAVPSCSRERIASTGRCPADSQVGISVSRGGFFFNSPAPVFSVAPPPGVAAQFAFDFANATVYLDASVRPGDQGITIGVRNLPQTTPIVETSVEFWGVPADPSHDGLRGYSDRGVSCIVEAEFGNPCSNSSQQLPEALLTNPTKCTAPGVGLETRLSIDSWANPGLFSTASFLSHLPPPDEGVQQGPEGCDIVPFEPSLVAQPTSREADAPTGLNVSVEIPQDGLGSPQGIAMSTMKRAEVVLPEGMSVNPSSANGLAACTTAEIGLGSAAPVRCPAASKIASVDVETPLLDEPLDGAVYLAKQGDNPFNSLLAMYMVVESEQRGVRVKLPGRVIPDPDTGRLTASFDDNPQLPFSAIELRFQTGNRAPLMTPRACGTYTTTARLTPWSAADPGNPTPEEVVTSTSSFTIDQGPNGAPCPVPGQFAPAFEAGTVTPIAGDYTPLMVNATRPDGSGPLKAIELKLPPGLTGKLAGIPYCPEAALAAAAARSGNAELESPSCPAQSRVGTVDVSAGAGSAPYHAAGIAYLTGPYKGAPLSLAVITPAVAGPFDLGTVVVRTALKVDPTNAQVTAISDQIPHILQGIPLAVRSVHVDADRDQFAKNPTSCRPMSLEGVLSGPSVSKALSSPFQVGACAALGFKPRLAISLKGGTKRGAYPKLKAVLTQPEGQANIGKVSVALPHSEFLAQEHIKTICTRVQFAVESCPPGSIYGKARAFSPLLDQPLEGPVYLRSSSNPLPDLVMALHGQIDIDLTGRIDSVDGGIRNTFSVVPDAPVTKFVLEMQGGKKGLLVNSRDICKSTNRATVKMSGQNGKAHNFSPVLKAQCRKGKGK